MSLFKVVLTENNKKNVNECLQGNR